MQLEQTEYQLLTELCTDGLCVISTNGKILEVNDTFCHLFGYQKQELINHSFNSLGISIDINTILHCTSPCTACHQVHTQLIDKNGKKSSLTYKVQYEAKYEHIFIIISPNANKQGSYTSTSIVEKIFNNSTEAIVVTDHKGVIILTNAKFSQITGYSSEEAIGNTPAMLKSGRHNRRFYKNFWRKLYTNGNWSGEIWNKRKNGNIYPEWLNISSIKKENGEISYFIAQFSDISAIKKSESMQRFYAYHDPLTLLPNRRLLFDRLEQLQVPENSPGFAVLFCDLDRFKSINDTLGHHVGDEVLKVVASKFRAALRDTDTIARSGGDEFIVVVEGQQEIQHIEQIATHILDQFNGPMKTKFGEFFISVSIGISKFPCDSRDIRELISFADIAMYQIKKTGGDNFAIFDSKQKQHILHQIELENTIHKAIENNELSVWYQPQVSAKTNQVYGVECLLRWQHSEHGFISPELFIPIAERNGLIKELGEFVLTTACHQLRQWRINNIFTGLIAINVSPRQFDRDNLIGQVKKILMETSVPAHCIELEVTESIFAKEDNFHISILEELRNLGVKIAIDDFGTGYSSLARLKQLPIDNLKIDKSFIDNLSTCEKDLSVVNALCLLSRSFDIDIIAEGVEHPHQAALLQKLGCFNHQGYLYGKPMPAEQFEQWITNFSLPLSTCSSQLSAITTTTNLKDTV